MKNQNRDYQINLRKLNEQQKIRHTNGIPLSLSNSPKNSSQNSAHSIFKDAFRTPKIQSPYKKQIAKRAQFNLPYILKKPNLKASKKKGKVRKKYQQNIFLTQESQDQNLLQIASQNKNYISLTNLSCSPRINKIKVVKEIYNNQEIYAERRIKPNDQGCKIELKIPILKCNKCLKHKELFSYLEIGNKRNWM